jgi:exopolysaccharide biosynthesis polyprenyl glycosylphosphotransferase
MIRRHATTFRLALMAADGIGSVVLFVGLSMLRFGPRWRDSWSAASVDPVATAIVLAALWVGALWLGSLYDLRARWSFRSELLDVVHASVGLAVGLFCLLFLVKLPDVSRLFLVSFFAAEIALTLAARIVLRALFAAARARGHNTRFVLVVGVGPSADGFARRIARHRQLGLRVVGHLAEDGGVRAVANGSVLGSIADIESVLHAHVVDEVVICLPSKDAALVEPIARLCEDEGRIVRIPLDGPAPHLTGGYVEEFDGIPVLSLAYGPDRILALIGKRLLDLTAAAVGLVVLAPVFLVLGLWIRTVDGGPVLFWQVRVGLNGRPFRVVKFRTMVRDAEARLSELESLNVINGHAFKLDGDPRMTRTGRLLRRASLDELPQLWNVLRGEMSLVGPRPPLPREVQGYDIWHRRRLSMKPGITGLWQVEARREPEFDRWVTLDLAYIDRWSLWLDIKIMLRTVPAMLLGR